MSLFSIFGSEGYVGRHLALHLEAQGHEVRRFSRTYWPQTRQNLGHAVYAIGMTANFRGRPFETVEAHVVCLKNCLENFGFESFLYLSSTRVYQGAGETNEESNLAVNPTRRDDLYNLTKLTGESLCLGIEKDGLRVARLSNIFGGSEPSDSFLGSVLKDIRESGRTRLLTGLRTAKDYVEIAAVCHDLERIALDGQHRLYNVARGTNTTNAEIAALLRAAGAAVEIAPDAPETVFPPVSVDRLRLEFPKDTSSFAEEFKAALTGNFGELRENHL